MDKTEKAILDLVNSEEFFWLEEYYSRRTIFDILNVPRKENYHSNFIAWLFNDKANHNLNDYAIRLIELHKELTELCGEDLKDI